MPQLEEPAESVMSKKHDAKKATHHRDPTRETIETIVFVAVLVLLLKLFVTEAFVIPTGSMATTLLGIHKIIDCPKCGYQFPVNSHDEVEGNQQNGHKNPLYGYCCPNCRYLGHVKDLPHYPSNRTGDRVLVLKPIYSLRQPQRGDVVVFKYPGTGERRPVGDREVIIGGPQDKQTAQNYIKRAEGFGGETIAVYRGKLYVTRSLSYSDNELDAEGKPLFPRPENPLDLWLIRYMYSTVYNSNPRGVELFNTSLARGFPAGTGGFEIVRKGEQQLLANRRIVWNNDQQPPELASFQRTAALVSAGGGEELLARRQRPPTQGLRPWRRRPALDPLPAPGHAVEDGRTRQHRSDRENHSRDTGEPTPHAGRQLLGLQRRPRF